MKISTKTRYGLRAMAYLTKKNDYASVKEISDNEEIPYDYLEKIFNRLKAANLVKVKLGAQGGYRLAKPAKKITAGGIIRAIEETLVPVMCTVKEGDKIISCKRSKSCVAKKIWLIVQHSLAETLEKISLADLVKSN